MMIMIMLLMMMVVMMMINCNNLFIRKPYMYNKLCYKKCILTEAEFILIKTRAGRNRVMLPE